MTPPQLRLEAWQKFQQALKDGAPHYVLNKLHADYRAAVDEDVKQGGTNGPRHDQAFDSKTDKVIG